jgi:hypothetical protein
MAVRNGGASYALRADWIGSASSVVLIARAGSGDPVFASVAHLIAVHLHRGPAVRLRH